MKTKIHQFTIASDSLAMDAFLKRYHFDQQETELLQSTGRFLSEILTV